MPKSPKILFEVALAVYPLEAIYAACYIYIDRAFVRLSMTLKGDVRVEMSPKPDVLPKKFADIEGHFRNELLHQALRLKVSGANQKLREYIVAQALTAAQPQAETAR